MNRRRSPAAQLASLCRTCMSRWNDRIMHNIYDKCGLNDKDPTIIELLQEVHKHSAAATMLPNDFHNKLPQVICSGCVENLQISYDFLRMCSESEKKFEKMLKDLDNRDDNAILEECINGPEDGVTFTVFSVKKEPAEDDAERFDYEYEAEPLFAYDRLASSHYEEDVHGDEEDLLSDNHFINMDDYECDDYDNYIDGDGDDDDNDYIDFSNSQEMR